MGQRTLIRMILGVSLALTISACSASGGSGSSSQTAAGTTIPTPPAPPVIPPPILPPVQVSTFDVIIDGGVQYTNDSTLHLNLTLPPNTPTGDVKIGFTSDCSDGQWEPYSSTASRTIPQSNSVVNVSVQFRNFEGIITSCATHSIVHDNIAPTIIVDTTIPTFVNVPNLQIGFHAEDQGSGVDELECILPGQTSATPCSGLYNGSTLADGGYVVQFLARDHAGNLAAPTTQTFTVDTTPPVVTLNSTPTKFSSSSSATFEFAGSDALSGLARFECRLDGKASFSTCSSPLSYTALGQGTHVFQVRAVDNAGNVATGTTYSWTVDTQSPNIRFTSTPAPVTNLSNGTFAFSGEDGLGASLTQFQCRLDGAAFSACSSPVALGGLSEGSHSFSVRGIGQTGIPSADLTYNWTVDLTGLSINITQGPAALTNANSATFIFTVTDGLSGVASVGCSLDGSALQDCASLVQSYSGLKGDMQHSFVVRATDRAGNATTSPVYSWFIDNTAPMIAIESGPQALVGQGSAEFHISGTDTHGDVTFQCKLDSAPVFTSCSTVVNFVNQPDGTHTFFAQSRDGAGNLSMIASYSWTIETVGPVIKFTQTPDSTILSTDHGVFKYTITDALSTVSSANCMIDATSMTCASPSGAVTLPALPAGSHTFVLTATNSAGITSSLSYTFVSRDLNCTTTLDTTTVPTKMLFVVDMSGSNQSSPGCALGPNCTDEGKKMRAGSIQKFFNDYGSHTNFGWGFDTFAGSSSSALINSGSTSSPIFGVATSMQTAINTFKGLTDSGATPYMAALRLATTAISNDPDIKSANNPQYIVVFLSDGQPNGSGDTTTNILSQIDTIVGLSPGRISFNTIYYGPADTTASGLLQSMATRGHGNFLNTNTNPTGLAFSISDIIAVPVTTCH